MDKMNFTSKEVFTIPNIISLFRILIIYPFVLSFLSNNYLLTVILLLVSALSDMFDGKIARKLGQETKLGEMFDPVADKLTLTAVVICIGIKFPEVWAIVILLIFKELLVVLGGIYLLKKGIYPPKSQWYGKLSTVIFYISTSIIIILDSIFCIRDNLVIFLLMTLTALSMMYTLIRYFILFLYMIKSNDRKN